MAMVGEDSSLWQPIGRRTRVGGGERSAPFYIHQMNRVNSHNDYATTTAAQTLSLELLCW